MDSAKPIYYPQVTRIPGQGSDANTTNKTGEPEIKKGEFDQSLNQAMQHPQSGLTNPNLSALKSSGDLALDSSLGKPIAGIKFSAHATQRLKERSIQFDKETLSRMNDAITKADAKGVQDTLVLTDKAALIVSVPNRTVITAMDRNNLSGNVFTNIDGAVII